MYKTVVFFPRLYIDALWMFEPSEQEKMLILKGKAETKYSHKQEISIQEKNIENENRL